MSHAGPFEPQSNDIIEEKRETWAFIFQQSTWPRGRANTCLLYPSDWLVDSGCVVGVQASDARKFRFVVVVTWLVNSGFFVGVDWKLNSEFGAGNWLVNSGFVVVVN